MSSQSFPSILSQLQGVKATSNGWSARCPAHDDSHNSLSIAEGTDGRILLKCFAGCSFDEILTSLGLRPGDLFPPQSSPSFRTGGGLPSETRSTLQHSQTARGCTLAAYAQAKRLPPEFLQQLGLTQISYGGGPAVRIPYFDLQGQEVAVRFRVGLTGHNRFRWKTGCSPQLYGQERLAQAHLEGFIVFVEGESDCHTLWYHHIPSVGLPGASTWNEERDGPLLKNIPTIYVLIEPDRGGQTIQEWVATSGIKDRVSLVTLHDAKDPSELYVADPDRFAAKWQTAMEEATPWTEYHNQRSTKQHQQAEAECERLVKDPALLDRFCEDLSRSGVAVDAQISKLLYLVVTSRLLSQPLSVAVKGPSSAGKSYIVEKILSFFPSHAYYTITAMSERALAYSQEPLSHRMLVLIEMAGMNGDLASYLLRSLLSEGRLCYETVEPTRQGLKPRRIEREGPTGLIVTTTRLRLHPENETRLLSITVNDTPEQTRQILRVLAQEPSEKFSMQAWHALQLWLETGPREVCIPFAGELADLIPPVAVRLRRDFKFLLTLIETHAFLHQASREHDSQGRILATFQDYQAVRELVADIVAEGADTTVSPTIQETVTTLAQLQGEGTQEISVSQLAKALKLDKAATSRRARSATDQGYLKNLEEKKGRPARLVMGDPLPEALEILPTPEVLEKRCCSVDGEFEKPIPPSPKTVEPQDEQSTLKTEVGTQAHFSLVNQEQPPDTTEPHFPHPSIKPTTDMPRTRSWPSGIKLKGKKARSAKQEVCCWTGCGVKTHMEYGGWFYCQDHAWEAAREALGTTASPQLPS